MEQVPPLTEVILSYSQKTLAKVHLDWAPQPGAYLDLDGNTYTVLERRHRYQLRLGKYQLFAVAVYVQVAQRPAEQTLIQNRWVIGDANCRYSARSELIRCAVNPSGPCGGCRAYEQRQDEI
jgi:Family of unknown function (DUF6464)